jgi:hypothetical protein
LERLTVGKKFFAKDAVALSRPGAKASIYLPHRCRFMVLVAGNAPSTLPITEAGNWEVDIPPELAATATEWPVLVLVIPKKHTAAFEKMSPEQTTGMIRQARSAYANAGN